MMHLLYQAISYLPYFLLLIVSVTILPALAFFPNLIRTPILATAIPIISILVVNILAVILYMVGLYKREWVVGLTLVIDSFAVWRVYTYTRCHLLQWDKSDIYILLLNCSLILPLVAFNGLSSFISNDALASWNYWALHYYMGEVPDTLGYPPFFPFLISYCYKLLGSTELQGAVKALLVFFPLTMLNAIAFVNRNTKFQILLFLFVSLIAVFPGHGLGFYRFYADGYADPMLAAAITASMALFLEYLVRKDLEAFIPAMLCGVLASLSKQPGLLWLFLIMPTLLLAKAIKEKTLYKREWMWLLIAFAPALIWLSNKGAHFYHNPGVVGRSFNNHPVSLISAGVTFWQSCQHYLFGIPSLLLLFIWAGYCCRGNFYKSLLFRMYILLSIGLWFIFGSYGLRLGLQITSSAGLLLASESYKVPPLIAHFGLRLSHLLPVLSPRRVAAIAGLLGGCVFTVFSFTDQINPHLNTPYRVYPLNAGMTNIYHHFGDKAEFIYNEIYNNSHITLWAPERLIAGIFYTHTPIISYNEELTEEKVFEVFKVKRPDYVFASLCDRKSADCELILTIASHHPGLLQEIEMKGASYDHKLFKLNKAYFLN